MAKRVIGEWAPSLPYAHKAFRPYALELGRLALSWNDLHVSLAMLFCNRAWWWFANPALAVWHALKADRSQRDILKAAVSATLFNGGNEALADEIKWICDRADALEEDRNNALHAPIWAQEIAEGSTVLRPVTGFGHFRAQKLLGKNLLAEFRWFVASATKLRNYATSLDFAFCRGSPLPERPVLPNRPNPSEKKRPLPISQSKRPRQPRSSAA